MEANKRNLIVQKVLGSLWGLALGDATGESGVKNLLKEKFLQPTDDTAMALALAESLIENRNFIPQKVAQKYLEYYEKGYIRLIGRSTYFAFMNLKRGVSWFFSGATGKYAAGNGVAMRIAPLGLWGALKNLHVYTLYEYVRQDGYITHRNELAISGAWAVAYAVYNSFKNFSTKEKIFMEVLKVFTDWGMENPVKENLQKVLDLFQKGTQTKKALKYLGTSGYVVESTASAFFLFLNEENFLQGMEILLDIGGDTDTIGAIYGAIFGAYYGIEKFPKDLLEKISIKEKIQKIAQDLINSC